MTTAAFQIAIWGQAATRWHDNLPYFTAYVVNYPFDVLTFVVAIWGLGRMAQSAALSAFFYGGVVVLSAVILAVSCSATYVVLDEYMNTRYRNFVVSTGGAPVYCPIEFSRCDTATPTLTASLPVLVTDAREPGRQFQLSVPRHHYFKLDPPPTSFRVLFKNFAISYWSVILGRDVTYTEVRYGTNLDSFVGPDGISYNMVQVADRPSRIRIDLAGPIAQPKFELLLGATTLIPVTAFLAAMLLLALARISGLIVRSVAMRSLETVTEPSPGKSMNYYPGTALGVLFGLLAVVAKAIADFLGPTGPYPTCG